MKFLLTEILKPRLLSVIIAGGLIPLTYVISLLIYNYQDNVALQDSSIKRYTLGVEKQAATIGYFFLERKYDIRSMANSLEIGTYFANKAMGMSEQYGLKVSLFTIRKMMKETIKNKTIADKSIYKRFIFVDSSKTILVNSGDTLPTHMALPCNKKLSKIKNEPELLLENTPRGPEFILATPCFFKKKRSGWIITWLNLKALENHFLNSSPDISSMALGLTTENGSFINLSKTTNINSSWANLKNEIANISDLKVISINTFPGDASPFLLTRIQIQSLPLFLTAYVKQSEILGNLKAWPFLAGIGAVIVIVALALILFLNTKTRNLILTARIDESKKQQKLLTAKNSQLEKEIIKRQQAEQFLKENEERYQKLFEYSSDAILILEGSTIIACNQKTAELLNLDRDEIINQDFHTFSPTTQPDGRESKAVCMMKRSGDVPQSQHFEWTLKTANNNRLDTEISMTILSFGSDTLIQLIIRDITERKRTQEILIQTEKMMAIGGLAAGMAHEINNPLGVILQANQNIDRRLGSTLKKNRETAHTIGLDFDKLQLYLQEKSITKYVQSIQSAGERAAKIVKSMLEFGRASEYSNKQLHNLNEILDTTIEMASTDYDLKKKFDFKNIEIKRFYSDIGMIMCEKTEIGQVFLNIIKNAAQAMNDFSLDKPTITLHTELISDNIRVTIEDNGPGIRDQDQKQIFEPFFTTKPVGEGTGLGLSVSYFIITSHYGGKVRVKSKQNKGTQFVIEFPKNNKNAAKRFIKS